MAEEGHPIKPWVERPVLIPWLEPYWEAFLVLSQTRPVGMGVGAIPLSEIVAYLDLHQVEDPEERRDTLRYVQILDRAFLDAKVGGHG